MFFFYWVYYKISIILTNLSIKQDIKMIMKYFKTLSTKASRALTRNAEWVARSSRIGGKQIETPEIKRVKPWLSGGNWSARSKKKLGKTLLKADRVLAGERNFFPWVRYALHYVVILPLAFNSTTSQLLTLHKGKYYPYKVKRFTNRPME